MDIFNPWNFEETPSYWCNVDTPRRPYKETNVKKNLNSVYSLDNLGMPVLKIHS